MLIDISFRKRSQKSFLGQTVLFAVDTDHVTTRHGIWRYELIVLSSKILSITDICNRSEKNRYLMGLPSPVLQLAVFQFCIVQRRREICQQQTFL